MGELGLFGEVICSGGSEGRGLVSSAVFPDLPVIVSGPVAVGEAELAWLARGCICMAVVPVAVWQRTRLPHRDVVESARVKPRSKVWTTTQWNQGRAGLCSFVIDKIDHEAVIARRWWVN